MGDSDDEYDRRRGRDKFRRERSDYNDRRRERDERPSRRDDWSTDRRREQSWDSRRRADYREFDRGRRDSSGRQMSPPGKRMRRDWDDPYHGGGGGGEYMPYGVPHHGGWGTSHMEAQPMQMGHQEARQPRVEMPEQNQVPAMMTFKQFLNAQDDNIDDTEAVQKYKEYKLEFRKTQTSDFFQQHKDEEWFKTKYHPKDSAARQKELQKAMRKRLGIFLELINSERAEKVVLDIDHTEAIVKFLDAIVIKLEGGTNNDLLILDRPPTPTSERHRRASSSAVLSPGRDNQEVSSQTATNSTAEEKKEPTSQAASSGTKSDSPPDVAPVSPSSVPLPDAPPPSASTKKSSAAKAKNKDEGAVKPISMETATPEQRQLQQQAQYYYQQQLYQQQQQQEYYAQLQGQQQQLADQSSLATQSTAEAESTKKEETGKKKRKRRHREPYYYDAMDDESESESESDSEPEPAPPGEETAMEASSGQEGASAAGAEAEGVKAGEDSLLPPGVDSPASADASIQLPSSSSAKAATPSDNSSKEDKQGDPAVGSSDPGPEPSAGVTAAGPWAPPKPLPDQPQSSSADSTQDTDQPESVQSTSEGDAKVIRPELPDQTVDLPMDQVGSTDNAVSDVKKEESSDLVSASSSEAEVKAKVVAVAVVAEPQPSQSGSEPDKPVGEQDKPVGEPAAKAAEVDSNKLTEKKEMREPESPVQAPTKKDKEQEVEVKEQDTTAAKPEHSNMNEPASSEPRALHKTLSLFLKSVPPNISKEDLTTICKRFPGFLRVAFSDPSPERKFTRRGWITFDRSVNIKDISWDLNNTRIKDIEIAPVLNRDLNRRVRTVPGITMATQVVRDDIKVAAKLIRELDSRMGLYEKKPKEDNEAKEKEKDTPAEKAEEGEEADVKQPEEKDPDLPPANPILLSLSEDAAQEEEGEEMELVGGSTQAQPGGTGGAEAGDQPLVELSADGALLRVLDRLLLYLRVVHSLDYYNGGDYPYEDEMPNRCGIVHVRGPPPDKATRAEADEWQKSLKQKLEPQINAKQSLPEEEVVQLGKKDPIAETERFVEANTQELAKDKWLCPLSGKKFRGPEFVKKHIFNKHADKVEAVRMEAEFFNSYLSDPRRPQVPEPAVGKLPGNPPPIGQMYSGGPPHGAQGMMGWGAPRPPMMMYGRGHYTPPSYGGYGHEGYGRGHTFPPKPRRFGFQGGRGRMSERGFHREARQLVQYRDLDAPEDVDVF